MLPNYHLLGEPFQQPLMEWQAQRHGSLRRFKPGSLPSLKLVTINLQKCWPFVVDFQGYHSHDGSMGRTVYSPTFPINFSQM